MQSLTTTSNQSRRRRESQAAQERNTSILPEGGSHTGIDLKRWEESQVRRRKGYLSQGWSIRGQSYCRETASEGLVSHPCDAGCWGGILGNKRWAGEEGRTGEKNACLETQHPPLGYLLCWVLSPSVHETGPPLSPRWLLLNSFLCTTIYEVL